MTDTDLLTLRDIILGPQADDFVFSGNDRQTQQTTGYKALATMSAQPLASFTGTSENNLIGGTGGNDVIDGRGGHDSLSGLGGNDTVIGFFPGSGRLTSLLPAVAGAAPLSSSGSYNKNVIGRMVGGQCDFF